MIKKPRLPKLDFHRKDTEGHTPFELACRHNKDQTMAPYLVMLDPSIDITVQDSKSGDTPVHCAFRNGSVRAVRCWMATKKFPEAFRIQNKDGDTAFHAACRSENVNVVRYLIESSKVDVGVQTKNGKGDTLFHIAFASRGQDMLSYLIKSHGAEMKREMQNNDGNTLLHVALIDNHSRKCLSLICPNKGTLDATIQNKDGDTALHLGMKNSNTDIRAMMLKSDSLVVDGSIRNHKGDTALHALCANKSADTSTAYAFFASDLPNVNFNAQNNHGDTPLHVASREGSGYILRYISRWHKDKFDPTVRNKNGETPMHVLKRDRRLFPIDEEMKLTRLYDLIRNRAIGYRNLHQACTVANGDAIDRLIASAPPSANLQDKNGDTPLHIAVRRNLLRSAESLVAFKGADPTIRNCAGDTALHTASKWNRKRLLKSLIKAESVAASSDVKNHEGKTAFDIANERGYDEVRVLLDEARPNKRMKVT